VQGCRVAGTGMISSSSSSSSSSLSQAPSSDLVSLALGFFHLLLFFQNNEVVVTGK